MNTWLKSIRNLIVLKEIWKTLKAKLRLNKKVDSIEFQTPSVTAQIQNELSPKSEFKTIRESHLKLTNRITEYDAKNFDKNDQVSPTKKS